MKKPSKAGPNPPKPDPKKLPIVAYRGMANKKVVGKSPHPMKDVYKIAGVAAEVAALLLAAKMGVKPNGSKLNRMGVRKGGGVTSSPSSEGAKRLARIVKESPKGTSQNDMLAKFAREVQAKYPNRVSKLPGTLKKK